MGFILSCATTPKRINKLIELIPLIKCRYKYFIINICSEYKRFGKFQIPRELLLLCKRDKRVVFNFIEDYGPICKYIGGFRFMKKKRLTEDKLIIIDDDIKYHSQLFYSLIEDKTKNNITTGSGFNFKNKCYYGTIGECDIVEGYAGICLDYNQSSNYLEWFIKFYNHFNFKSDNLIDKFLSACFLGDDFIISEEYNDKWAIGGGRNYAVPYDYGLLEDALQNNNIFGSNLKSYGFLYDNFKILKTFQLKYKLNKEINDRQK
tara:strand:- start:1400 stop:2185 length:786 start_codon:yes stop_codon:yes gene_type:complete